MIAQTKIFTVLFNQLINFHLLITSPIQPPASLLKTGLFSLPADQLCILINCMLSQEASVSKDKLSHSISVKNSSS